MKFNHISKRADKKSKEIEIDKFVAVKNWKAIGNKLNGFSRLSSFKIVQLNNQDLDINEDLDNNKSSDNLELKLF